MDPRQTTLVGGAALSLVVALAAANFLIWNPTRPHSSQPLAAVVGTAGAAPPQTDAAALPVDTPPQRGAVEPQPIDARHFNPLRPVDARADIDGGAPQPLAVTTDATPLDEAQTLSDREILALIDEELPGATDIEREVWLEELRDLGPDTMRRILRLWRQQHPEVALRNGAAVPEKSAAANPGCCQDGCRDAVTVNDPPLFVFDADLDHEQLIAQLGPSLEAAGQARDVILNNVANAGTVGFKRSEVLFRESGHAGHVRCEDGQRVRMTGAFMGAEGASVAEVRLDCRPGRMDRTGRPLDVAISGGGFLHVRCGDELLLTRAGRLTRGAGGQLVVTGAQGPCPLEPPIVVPDEAADVAIARDGAVLIRLAGQDEAFEAGRILIARCADPTALASRGGSLFAPTAESGPPVSGTPGTDGLGTLRSGALEQANVDLEREAAAFRKLQEQISVLSQIASGAIPLASARPMQLIAAPPAEDEPGEVAWDGGPDLGREPGLIDEYLKTRQTAREDGPELR